MEAREWLRLCVAIFGFVVSLVLSYVIVQTLGWAILAIAWFTLLVALGFVAFTFAGIGLTAAFATRPILSGIALAVIGVITAFLVITLAPVVKVLAWLILGYIFFVLFMKYLAPEIVDDISEFVWGR